MSWQQRLARIGLDLRGNQLSGEIPAELGSLSNLKTLWLYSNQLSGEIPPELGNLSNLQGLNLSYNDLSGVCQAPWNTRCGPLAEACPSAEATRPQRGTDSISPGTCSKRVFLWRMAPPPRVKYGVCPLLMTSLMAAVYTDEPQQVQACKGCPHFGKAGL